HRASRPGTLGIRGPAACLAAGSLAASIPVPISVTRTPVAGPRAASKFLRCHHEASTGRAPPPRRRRKLAAIAKSDGVGILQPARERARPADTAMPGSNKSTKPDAAPHYHGHRGRLRERFLQGGSDALHDY